MDGLIRVSSATAMGDTDTVSRARRPLDPMPSAPALRRHTHASPRCFAAAIGGTG